MPLINEKWLSKLSEFSMSLNLSNVYIIADQGVLNNSLLDGIQRVSPPVEWYSLFHTQPEEPLIEMAPVLMKLEFNFWQHRQWLLDLMTAFSQTTGLLIFVSPLSFESLASVMRNLADGAWEDRSGLVRYYDTRIFPLLVNKIFTEEQKSWMLNPVYLWSYRDRDGKVCWIDGSFSQDILFVPDNIKINFSDEQMFMLDIITDAQIHTTSANFDDLFSSQEEKFNTLWEMGCQARQEDYSGDLLNYYQQRLASQ